MTAAEKAWHQRGYMDGYKDRPPLTRAPAVYWKAYWIGVRERNRVAT